MNQYSEWLNDLGLKVEGGEYEGFAIVFDLKFEGFETKDGQNSAFWSDDEKGNTMYCSREGSTPVLDPKNKGLESNESIGGVTVEKKEIVMNIKYDTKMNRLHEVFHTLGLQHPEHSGTTGVMAYPPVIPNKENVQELISNNILKSIIK